MEIDKPIKTRGRLATVEELLAYRVLKNLIRLVDASTELLHAQGKMLDKWSDGDDNVKNGLWKNLHDKGDAVRLILDEIKETGKL
jgi:hypothetical protein